MQVIQMKQGEYGVYEREGDTSFVAEGHTEVCSHTVRFKLVLPKTHEFNRGDDGGESMAKEIEAALEPIIRKYTQRK